MTDHMHDDAQPAPDTYSFGTDYGKDLLIDINQTVHRGGTNALVQDCLKRCYREITRLRGAADCARVEKLIDAVDAAQPPAAPVETKSAPVESAPHNSGERSPSSDAASTGADTRSSAATEDVRWAVNYLLEQIAAKFEAWETFDLFRSEAAATVRSFKHDLSQIVGSDAAISDNSSHLLNDAAQPSAATSDAITALAKRFWSIHPKEIQDLGITREQFYEREMLSLLAALVPTEPQALPVPAVEIDETAPIMDLVWRNGDASFSIVVSQTKLIGIHCTLEPARSNVAWTVPLPDGLIKIDPAAYSVTRPAPQAAPAPKAISAAYSDWAWEKEGTAVGLMLPNDSARAGFFAGARWALALSRPHGGGK